MISPSKLSLNDLRDMAHANSREKGFWDECNNQPMDLIARLGLVMTEVAEAIECVRNSDMGSRTRVDGKPEVFSSLFSILAWGLW